jgi:hypothetical protein
MIFTIPEDGQSPNTQHSRVLYTSHQNPLELTGMLYEPVRNRKYLSSILNDLPLSFGKLSSFIIWRSASR